MDKPIFKMLIGASIVGIGVYLITGDSIIIGIALIIFGGAFFNGQVTEPGLVFIQITTTLMVVILVGRWLKMETVNDTSVLSSLSILACQITIPSVTNLQERDAHLQNSCAKIRRKLLENSVDLVALPELSSIDYSRPAFDNLGDLAETLTGPSFEAWRQIAREFKTYIAYSFPRRTDDGIFISLAVVGPAGDLVGHYDKLHLAQYGASMEKEYFQRGNHLFVFEIKGFRIAPIICYDIRIPELARTLAIDHDVDMILHSGAYFRDSSFYSWHQFAITRAMENQVYFLSLNRAGDSYGNSIFCLPWMDENLTPVTFPKHNELFKRIKITRTEIEFARENYNFLKDRLENYDLDTLDIPSPQPSPSGRGS